MYAQQELYTKPNSYEELIGLIKVLKERSIYGVGGYGDFRVMPNPFLTPDSELVLSWLKGSKLFKGKLDQMSVQLAYHGTYSDVVIDKICKDGFDPSRRRCQGLGSGEYFGTSPSIAIDFASSTHTLIATLVVSCPVTRIRNMGKILIVNNPLDRNITFCLPIFTIHYLHLPSPAPPKVSLSNTSLGTIAFDHFSPAHADLSLMLIGGEAVSEGSDDPLADPVQA